ncbi:hypothetical protein ACFWTC_38220, partial [Streptomyces sp. NPDC058619]
MLIATSAVLAAAAGSILVPTAADAVPAQPSQECKSGYVWREATGSGDRVCVTPGTRAQTREDNA